MPSDAPERWLPLAEAARELGISTDTVRRRLRKGELAGEHRPTPQGFVWWVCLGDAAQVGGAPRPHAAQVAPAPMQPAQAPGVVELVQLVDRLQRENRDLAGLVGSLQQRLIFADDRIRALEAPREPTPAEIASERATAGLTAETAQNTRRPWWLRWLPA